MRETALLESDWISAHAFYHEDLDRLVLDVIAPLTAELLHADLARRWFFLRYWDGGPHVRLRVLPAREADRPEVEALIRERFDRYFSEHPATHAVRQDEYARIASSLAHREGMSSHSLRLHPNNSLAFIPYRREHERYGVGASIQSVERHFCESSRLAVQALRAGASPDQRATAAAAVIFLAWFSGEPDPASLANWITTEGEDLTDLASVDRVDGFAGRPRDGLAGLARQMRTLAARAETLSTTGTLVDWARSLRTLRDALREQVADGSFTVPVRGWEGPGGIATTDPRGQVLVVLDLCAHLMSNRLGIAPVVEGSIRRLATEAVGALAEQGS